MIIFAKSELTIASQTLATTITVGSMCPGAKVAPSAFLSFLIDWLKNGQEGGRGGAPGQIYVSGNFWTINQTKNVKWSPFYPWILGFEAWSSDALCHNDLRPQKTVLQ